jgi:peptidoglycan hydrolase CwlO-like protein
MAQDFHAAFGTGGDDDKHIATVDSDGVALAAIQALNRKVDDLKSELQRRDAENEELRRAIEELKAVVKK